MMRRVTYTTGWLAWTSIILLIVLPWHDLRDHTHWGKVQWIPFVTPPIRLRDIVGNVLLYLPFGYWGRRAFPGRWGGVGIVALAAVLSFTTEATQLYSHRRFPSTTDLACNVFGTGCGIALARVMARRFRAAFIQESTA